ncbi:MAG TPA: MFS transporter [Burkholderiales bacterium]|nr:MFS transporter [Burkholderiales bacterium]
MKTRISATRGVLAMLCLMYFITYVDRVNVSTAAAAFKQELGFSNTQLGFVFSAFAYPYLVFQVIGGWLGDRFGARRTLFVCGIVWAAATALTGLAGGLVSMLAARVLLGLGEGATFPAATRAMSYWTASSRRGFAQGITHAFARIGNAVTPPMVAWLIVAITWRGSFFVLGAASLLWTIAWVIYFRDDPKDHPAITQSELKALPPYADGKSRPAVPWKRLVRRMAPVTAVYFCYGWTLWLFLSWIPLYFLQQHSLDLKKSAVFASGVFFAGVVGDALGGIISDWLLKRTGSRAVARRNLVVVGMLGAMASLLPLLFTQDLVVAAICLSLGFFFAELTIGPMWAIPMDIAPQFSGTASGLMNVGSAFAAIVSPVVAGWIIDTTGNWTLPFVGSMVLMLLGAIGAFAMKPERQMT